jgi:RNA polymerase sigma factor (TIGR02999 family)
MRSTSPDRDITSLLHAWVRGDEAALDQLLPLVYGELHRQAERAMRAQPAGHTLQTTALVHEAYPRLIDAPRADWQGRAHFFGVAARATRSVLVDHARALRARKRGSGAQVLTLGAADAAGAAGETAGDASEVDVEALDAALTRLAELDPRQARVVELRYFGGLSIGEAAEMLELSHATVEREWRTARLWLRRKLGGEHGGEPAPRPG